MSLKENVEYVKEEISAQESFLENFFKVEQFFKKYKNILIGGVAVVIIAFGGVSVSSYLQEQNKLEANEAFNTLLENPDDKKAQDTLKAKNAKLYEIAMFVNKKQTNVNTEFLNQLATYSAAIQSNSIEQLSKSAQDQKFILKEFAIFNQALLEAKKGEFKKAKTTVNMISSTSGIQPLANMLKHYLITK